MRADYLRDTIEAPRILIGHSLGGAAVLAAADLVSEARAVVTIGAPADTTHVEHLLGSSRAEIDAARHPKSFVSLDGTDHLLTDRAAAAYVAEVLVAWASRYLDAPPMVIA